MCSLPSLHCILAHFDGCSQLALEQLRRCLQAMARPVGFTTRALNLDRIARARRTRMKSHRTPHQKESNVTFRQRKSPATRRDVCLPMLQHTVRGHEGSCHVIALLAWSHAKAIDGCLLDHHRQRGDHGAVPSIDSPWTALSVCWDVILMSVAVQP